MSSNKLHLLAATLFCFSVPGSGVAAPGQSTTCVGRFYCESCLMNEPVTDSDTADFIKITVNPQAGGTWQLPSGAFKTVVICNDTACVTWQYLANGRFASVKAIPNLFRHFVNQDDYDPSVAHPSPEHAAGGHYEFEYGYLYYRPDSVSSLARNHAAPGFARMS